MSVQDGNEFSAILNNTVGQYNHSTSSSISPGTDPFHENDLHRFSMTTLLIGSHELEGLTERREIVMVMSPSVIPQQGIDAFTLGVLADREAGSDLARLQSHHYPLSAEDRIQ
jgi:hypothetical protein